MRLGHVHLRVSDVDRATRFWCEVIGFAISADGRQFGLPLVFLAADDYHHAVALNSMHSAGGSAPSEGHTGLHHVAILHDGPAELARAVTHVLDAGVGIDAAIDHGATVSAYLRDPDGHTIELYYDRPREQWLDSEGRPLLRNDPIGLEAITAGAA